MSRLQRYSKINSKCFSGLKRATAIPDELGTIDYNHISKMKSYTLIALPYTPFVAIIDAYFTHIWRFHPNAVLYNELNTTILLLLMAIGFRILKTVTLIFYRWYTKLKCKIFSCFENTASACQLLAYYKKSRCRGCETKLRDNFKEYHSHQSIIWMTRSNSLMESVFLT